MDSLKIIPLKQAEITAPKGILYMLGEMESLVTAPVFIFFIQGSKKNILVDAGAPSPGEDGLVQGLPLKGGGVQGTIKALEELNLKPEDIDILILTHLHYDHVGTLELFQKARIYLQKKEWEAAFHPIPIARGLYLQNLFIKLEKMDTALLEGTVEIENGITLFSIPGHAPGQQAVSVKTSQGQTVLAGDHFYSYYNLFPETSQLVDLHGKQEPLIPRPDLPFLPPGIHVNLDQWYDSAWKIVSMADSKDLVIPGHEPSIIGKEFL